MTDVPRPSARPSTPAVARGTGARETHAGCYSDEVLAAFQFGKLDNGRLERQVADHVLRCATCVGRLAHLPRERTDDSLPSSTAPPMADADTQTILRRRESPDAAHLAARPADVPSLADRPAPRPDAKLPVKLQEFFVIRELGEGANGKVLLARDPQHNRLVALKTPGSRRPFTPEMHAAFVAEARTIATLDHPHIVWLYDCREFADGRCMLVMRYIDGQSLTSALDRSSFTPRRAAEIVLQIADALQYAHERKICHRDVKPANILLDSQSTAYLADFGLAVHSELQRDGPADGAGTYPYMAPEQFTLDGPAPDFRADIWSLGVVLYELLARRRPFPGRTIETVRDEVLSRPHPPLTSLGSSLDPSIAVAVDADLANLSAICDRCLAKNVEQRYSSAAELAADLRAYLAAPGRRSARRRSVMAASAAAVVTLGIGLWLAATYDWFATATPRLDSRRDESKTVAPTSTSRFVDQNRPVPNGEFQTGAPQAGIPKSGSRKNGTPPSDTTQPDSHWLFTRDPVAITWGRQGDDGFHVDTERQRLTMRLEGFRGLIEFGELATANFSASHTLILEEWPRKVGFYWAFQPDHATNPDSNFRCLALNAYRRADGRLYLAVDELKLQPLSAAIPGLICPHSANVAKGSVPMPDGDRVELYFQVVGGLPVELRVNDMPCELQWPLGRPEWPSGTPARYGFHLLNGSTIIERAAVIPSPPEGKLDEF